MLIGLPDFGKRKKVIENRDKSKIVKYFIFPICFYQRETLYIYFFYKFDKFEIDSEPVSSDNTVFLRITATQV